MKRPTISDIAARAGVSKGAVSYALNGRPGVSAQTRARIVAIAQDLGWRPDSAARALSGGRVGVVGMVLTGPPGPSFPALVAGIQRGLGEGALLLQVAADAEAELAIYRRWRAERRVDGVLLASARTRDARPADLLRLGLPAVALDGPAGAFPAVPARDAADEVLSYLAAMGHARVTRIAGPAELARTEARSAAFTAAAGAFFEAARIVEAGRSDGTGAARAALTSPRRPTALLCDTDTLAVAALGIAQELGLSVPGDVSLVSWEDSVLCRLIRPALSAVRWPVAETGALGVALLRALVAGKPLPEVIASPPYLVTRGSTGPAPR